MEKERKEKEKESYIFFVYIILKETIPIEGGKYAYLEIGEVRQHPFWHKQKIFWFDLLGEKSVS